VLHYLGRGLSCDFHGPMNHPKFCITFLITKFLTKLIGENTVEKRTKRRCIR